MENLRDLAILLLCACLMFLAFKVNEENKKIRRAIENARYENYIVKEKVDSLIISDKIK